MTDLKWLKLALPSPDIERPVLNKIFDLGDCFVATNGQRMHVVKTWDNLGGSLPGVDLQAKIAYLLDEANYSSVIDIDGLIRFNDPNPRTDGCCRVGEATLDGNYVSDMQQGIPTGAQMRFWKTNQSLSPIMFSNEDVTRIAVIMPIKELSIVAQAGTVA